MGGGGDEVEHDLVGLVLGAGDGTPAADQGTVVAPADPAAPGVGGDQDQCPEPPGMASAKAATSATVAKRISGAMIGRGGRGMGMVGGPART